jgi:P pilus assembly chaperone PapD
MLVLHINVHAFSCSELWTLAYAFLLLSNIFRSQIMLDDAERGSSPQSFVVTPKLLLNLPFQQNSVRIPFIVQVTRRQRPLYTLHTYSDS